MVPFRREWPRKVELPPLMDGTLAIEGALAVGNGREACEG